MFPVPELLLFHPCILTDLFEIFGRPYVQLEYDTGCEARHGLSVHGQVGLRFQHEQEHAGLLDMIQHAVICVVRVQLELVFGLYLSLQLRSSDLVLTVVVRAIKVAQVVHHLRPARSRLGSHYRACLAVPSHRTIRTRTRVLLRASWSLSKRTRVKIWT